MAGTNLILEPKSASLWDLRQGEKDTLFLTHKQEKFLSSKMFFSMANLLLRE